MSGLSTPMDRFIPNHDDIGCCAVVGVPAMIRCLSDDDEKIRTAAAKSLSRHAEHQPENAFVLPDRSLLETLCKALRQREGEVRKVASDIFRANPHILNSAGPFLRELAAENRVGRKEAASLLRVAYAVKRIQEVVQLPGGRTTPPDLETMASIVHDLAHGKPL